MEDPGHLDASEAEGRVTPPARGVRICAGLAVGLAVFALVLALVPVTAFSAGLPALAAVVLAVVAVVLGARRLLPVIGAALAAVALVVAVVVSVHESAEGFSRMAAGPSTAPTSSTSGRGSTGELAVGAHRVVYEVLGSGTTSVTYAAFVGGASGGTAEDTVAVPHRRAQRLTLATAESARFSMVAVAGGAGEAIGCRISIDGRAVAERSASTGRAAACVAVAG